MSLHFFLILSQKTSFKTAPQAWQVKNVKSACAADMTFQYVSHITCLSSCLFVSSIFPVCFLCFLVFVLLLAFSAPFNLCAHLNMQCCNAACIWRLHFICIRLYRPIMSYRTFACTHVSPHVMFFEEVELLDEVDDDDAPADIPSFEDLLEKEAGRSSSVTSVPYETKLPNLSEFWKFWNWRIEICPIAVPAASLADSGHQSHCGRLHQEDLGFDPCGWSALTNAQCDMGHGSHVFENTKSPAFKKIASFSEYRK